MAQRSPLIFVWGRLLTIGASLSLLTHCGGSSETTSSGDKGSTGGGGQPFAENRVSPGFVQINVEPAPGLSYCEPNVGCSLPRGGYFSDDTMSFVDTNGPYCNQLDCETCVSTGCIEIVCPPPEMGAETGSIDASWDGSTFSVSTCSDQECRAHNYVQPGAYHFSYCADRGQMTTDPDSGIDLCEPELGTDDQPITDCVEADFQFTEAGAVPNLIELVLGG